MNKPIVSIGMPVYNGGRTLRAALDTIVNQSFQDFELIISDNNSTDDTELICREYLEKNPKITYIRQETNIGATKNYEFVLSKSVGEYFMLAAHDDLRDKDFLAECVGVFNENLDCVSVFCHFQMINTINNEIVEHHTPTPSSTNFPLHRIKGRVREMVFALIYGLHKREIINKIKLENFDWSDVYFNILLSYYGKILIIPKFMFQCGTNGVRIPYSVTGKYISLKIFRSLIGKFLKDNFEFRERFFLLLRIYYLSYVSERAFNSKAKQSEL